MMGLSQYVIGRNILHEFEIRENVFRSCMFIFYRLKQYFYKFNDYRKYEDYSVVKNFLD